MIGHPDGMDLRPEHGQSRYQYQIMNIIRDITNLKLHHTVVTLGKFDGSHIGHQLLFETAVKLKPSDGTAVIFTFDIHPEKILREMDGAESSVLKPEQLRMIQTNLEKEHCNYPKGIDYLIEYPFNAATREMEPEQFVQEILVKHLGVSAIVCGDDFRFGKDRKGTVDTLRTMGERYGFQVHVMDKVTITLPGENIPRQISSTLIKEEIRKGHMDTVTTMLGTPFAVTGTILHGKHLGNTIGFPTINMQAPPDKVLPPDGVYATITRIDQKEYRSITNIGVRPTFCDGDQRTIETSLFDFDQDVYGQTAAVSFYLYLRPEKKFPDLDALQQQILSDKAKVLEYFRNSKKTEQ